MQALALVETLEHVCCRYRIRAFGPALRDAGVDLSIRGLGGGLIDRVAAISAASHHETTILQRKLLPGWQLALLRHRAKCLVFDFDDAVLYRDSYDPRGVHCPRRARRFAATVRAADLVLAGNPFLAQAAVDGGARPERVRVQPTVVDTTKYVIMSIHNPPVRLAWIGSSSTLQGIEQRRPLWERLGREVPGLTFRLICDRPAEFGPLAVENVPWSEPDEAADLAGADVGIALVPDDLWSRGKCGLKVLQYQAAGLPVVANPVGVQAMFVRHGVDGFLAETDDEWQRAVATLAADPGLRARMGAAGRASVQRHASVAAWSEAFVGAALGASTARSRPVPTAARPMASAAAGCQT